MSEVFDWRVKNIVDATSFREPEKVPVGFEYTSWPFGYAGVTFEEVIDDPERNAKEFCKFMEEIKFDFTMNPGRVEPYNVFEALGSKGYTLCDDKCTVQHNQVAGDFMTEEEYDILINDADYFRTEYFLKKKVPAFKKPRQEAYEMLKQAAICTRNSIKTFELIAKTARETYGIVPIVQTSPPSKEEIFAAMNPGQTEAKRLYGAIAPFYYSEVDNLFDTYRGMMGVFEDLMENTEKIDAACRALRESAKRNMPPMPPVIDGTPLPMGAAVYHIASFLSPEQYDKYWFKGLKEVMMPFAEAGKKIFIKGQGRFLHTIESFKDFPKGSVVIQLDNDDPFEAYKKIGGYQTICAGVQTHMFQLNNRQKCIDYVKKVFDTFAPGGGFMFYQDRPLLSPSDASIEDVRAVWSFANEYSWGGKHHD